MHFPFILRTSKPAELSLFAGFMRLWVIGSNNISGTSAARVTCDLFDSLSLAYAMFAVSMRQARGGRRGDCVGI